MTNGGDLRELYASFHRPCKPHEPHVNFRVAGAGGRLVGGRRVYMGWGMQAPSTLTRTPLLCRSPLLYTPRQLHCHWLNWLSWLVRTTCTAPSSIRRRWDEGVGVAPLGSSCIVWACLESDAINEGAVDRAHGGACHSCSEEVPCSTRCGVNLCKVQGASRSQTLVPL